MSDEVMRWITANSCKTESNSFFGLTRSWLVIFSYRVKKGRALCTWPPYMGASHVPRSSSRMVITYAGIQMQNNYSLFFSPTAQSSQALATTVNLYHGISWLYGPHLLPLWPRTSLPCFFLCVQVGRLTVWINMAIPLFMLLLSMAMSCWSALSWQTVLTQPGTSLPHTHTHIHTHTLDSLHHSVVSRSLRQGIHGMFPLHLAVLYGFSDCCRKLLSSGEISSTAWCRPWQVSVKLFWVHLTITQTITLHSVFL